MKQQNSKTKLEDAKELPHSIFKEAILLEFVKKLQGSCQQNFMLNTVYA